MLRTYFIIFIGIIAFNLNVRAAAVVSVCNGAWEDPSVWSTGTVPKTGDGVYINHLIRFNQDLVLDNIEVTINELAGLCGDYDLELLTGSNMIVRGVIITKVWTIRSDVQIWGKHIAEDVQIISGSILVSTAQVLDSKAEYYCFDGPGCSPAILRKSQADLRCNMDGGVEYLWYYDGASMVANTQEIEHEGEGEYWVRFVNTLGDTSAFSKIYMLNLTSSAGEIISTGLAFEAYPNPFNGSLTVKVPEVLRALNLRVINAQGAVVYQTNSIANYNRIDLNRTSPGLFVVEVTYNDGSRLLNRILKN